MNGVTEIMTEVIEIITELGGIAGKKYKNDERLKNY